MKLRALARWVGLGLCLDLFCSAEAEIVKITYIRAEFDGGDGTGLTDLATGKSLPLSHADCWVPVGGDAFLSSERAPELVWQTATKWIYQFGSSQWTFEVGHQLQPMTTFNVGANCSVVDWCADVPSLTPDVPHQFRVDLPAMAADQFQGLFLDNVEAEFTESIQTGSI
jgi:hypothetical protein